MRTALTTCLAVAFLGFPGLLTAQTSRSELKTVSGTIKEVKELKRMIVFETVQSGLRGPQNLPDAMMLDRNCTITLDGKSVSLNALQPGHLITIEYDSRGPLARTLTVVSPEAKKKADLERHRQETLVAREFNEKAAAAAARRATAIRAAWEAQAQEYARQQIAARELAQREWTGREWGTARDWAWQQYNGHASRGTRPSARGGVNDEQGLALLELFGGLLAEGAARGADRNGNRGAAVLWRTGRDHLLEDALERAFPDSPGGVRRAARRVGTQILEGRLSPRNFAVETIRDEAIEALRRENEGLGTAAEIGVVLYELFKAGSRR